MSNSYSLQEVFRHYLESQNLSGPSRSIGELIASGGLSRATFDDLLEVNGVSPSLDLKEDLLDLILVFLQKCIEDHELSGEEMAELRSLIIIFRIEEGDFYELRRDAIQETLVAQATHILEDRYVTKQEDILQTDLQRVLGLSYDQYVGLLRPLAKKHIEELETKRLATQNVKLIDSTIQNLRSVFLIGQ